MPKRKTLTVGQEIRKARKAAGLTQGDLAYQVGLRRGPGEIGDIERDDKHVKSWRIIEAVLEALAC